METKDLLPFWLDEAVQKAKEDVKRTDQGYDALKNKTTTYAKSILFMRNARRDVLTFWEKRRAEYLTGMRSSHALLIRTNEEATPDFVAVLEEIQGEIEGRYDGAIDSNTLWLGRSLELIDKAINEARQILRSEAQQ